MPEKYISLNEAHRVYGVALTTLRRKIQAGELTRVDGKGITLASLKRVYGEPSAPPHTGESATPERSGKRGGSARGSEGVALSPEHVAELAALRAERDTLKATLEHERSDREKERQAWSDKYELLSQSIIAIKGADYARDMATVKLAAPKADVIDGEASEPKREGKSPKSGQGARRKATPPDTDHAPHSNRTGLLGWLAKWRA